MQTEASPCSSRSDKGVWILEICDGFWGIDSVSMDPYWKATLEDNFTGLFFGFFRRGFAHPLTPVYSCLQPFPGLGSYLFLQSFKLQVVIVIATRSSNERNIFYSLNPHFLIARNAANCGAPLLWHLFLSKLTKIQHCKSRFAEGSFSGEKHPCD